MGRHLALVSGGAKRQNAAGRCRARLTEAYPADGKPAAMDTGPLAILKSRVFWLLLISVICLAGFPQGYLMTIIKAGGIVIADGEAQLADGGRIGGDYTIFWSAGRAALDGNAASLYDPSSFRTMMQEAFGAHYGGFRWLYPPHWLTVIAPMALLPFTLSYLAFVILTFGLFLRVAQRIVGDLQFLLLLTATPVMLVTALFGQNGFLISAIMLAALFLENRRGIVSGILIGLLTLKPQFGLVVPFALAARHAWQTIAVAAATAAGLAALSAALFGIEPWIAWISGLGTAPADLMETRSQDYLGLQISVHASLRLLGAGDIAAAAGQGLTILAAIGLAAAGVRQAAPDRLKACLVVACSYLATPYGMIYDLPALSFVCLWLYLGRQGRAAGPALSGLALMILALPFVNILLVAGGMPLAPVMIAGLAVAVFIEIRDAARQETPTGTQTGTEIRSDRPPTIIQRPA